MCEYCDSDSCRHVQFALSISAVQKIDRSASNSYPGHEKWNAKVDVDDSLAVNIIDITRVAKEFGKSP